MDPDGDPAFRRSETISAVQDVDQYYGEDDDFDELYNDVNVGDGFLRNSNPPPPPPPQTAPPPQQLHQQQQQLPPPPQGQPPQQHQHQQPPLHSLPPPPQHQQPPPHSLSPPPPLAPPQQKAHVPSAAPAPNHPPTQPNLPPLPQPPAGHPPPQHQQIQQGDGFHRPGGNYGGGPVVVGNGGAVVGVDGSGSTTLFVGELHWWTTDADLEAELSKYGPVKEVRFFDEKASGKSKGYCQVDFYDPAAAAACKEGMNGHPFNGRPCVVAFASPNTVRRMGEAQVKNQQALAAQTSPMNPKGGRGGGGAGAPQVGGNYAGGRGGAGGGAGGNWGRGGGGVGRGGGGIGRRMGPGGGRGIMANGNMVAPPPPMLPPMLPQGFDPTYGAMGRFGGFPGGPGPFPGMMQPFPPVAPHVNPAFFGRGGMGPGGVGMWPDPNIGPWGGEEQSSYGDDAASDQQYGEGANHGKDRPPEREWSGVSDRRREREKEPPAQEWPERRHRDEGDMGLERDRDYDRDRERDRERDRVRDRDREKERERDRHRDGRDRHGDYHRHRDRDSEREDWDRGRSSGIRNRSRELDHSKRRRMTPE